MIRCVVFDFDGTLVDSNQIKTETFYTIAHPWDHSGAVVAEVFERWPTADRYEKTAKIAEMLIAENRLPKGASAHEWATRFASHYTTQCESAIATCAEIPGAGQLFEDLMAQGTLLFINSATPEEPLRKLLKLRGWTNFFQAIYGGEASKADNLRSIATTTGTNPDEIVHIGDQQDDLQAAEQFGCHFIAVAAPNSGPVGKVSPLVVTDLWTLPTVIAKLNLGEQ